MTEHLNGLQHKALKAYPLNTEEPSCFSNSDGKKLAQAKQVHIPNMWGTQAGFPFSMSLHLHI